MPTKLSMPMSSWSMLKQIVRAYGQVQDAEKPTVDAVAEIASVQRSVVSANNNFLRDIGIVSREENKPTPLGAKLADTLVMENDALIAETLQEIVRDSATLNQWVGMVRARGSMKVDHLKATIALAGGITDKSKSIPSNAIIDMLQDSKMIQVNDDTVRVGGVDASSRPPLEEGKPYVSPNAPMSPGSSASPNAPMGGTQNLGTPLPLGPSRMVYIQFPSDWNASRDLPKLLKMLQIAFGEDSEV
jgi:hypothetical protein